MECDAPEREARKALGCAGLSWDCAPKDTRVQDEATGDARWAGLHDSEPRET